MPITVHYQNNSEHKCVISPTPLISINSEILKTGGGEAFGVTYQITLNGTIIANEGTPYGFKTNDDNTLFQVFGADVAQEPADPDNPDAPSDPTPTPRSDLPDTSLCGPYCAFDKRLLHKRPPRQVVDHREAMTSILSKQKALRALFALDGQRVEITDWVGIDDQQPEIRHNPVLVFYPRINSISFSEGVYVDTATYTIVMEADVLLSNIDNADNESNFTVDIDATLLMASSGDYLASGINGLEGMDDGVTQSNGSKKKIDLLPSCAGGGEDDISSPSDQVAIAIHKAREKELEEFNQHFISDFDESWSIEVDEQFGENFGDVPLEGAEVPFRDLIQPRSYIISHNVSAVGKTHYGPEGKTQAWEEARKFVQNRLFHHKTSGYPLASGYPNMPGATDPDELVENSEGNQVPRVIPAFFGKGALNLSHYYNGFNHSRNENIGYTDGSYSVTETWLVASGTDLETYDMTVTSSLDSPFVNIGVQGKIKGLSSVVPSSVYFGGQYNETEEIPDEEKRDTRFLVTPYMNALEKWYKISKSGVFGLTSDLYRRANSLVAVELNSQPLEISLATNEYTGEIDYSLSFDNRPTNIISGTLLEDINVNETYPGDVFSVIPVIGRKTGPVLQYNGSRTAYTRDLTIDLTMDSTKIPYDKGRKMLIRRPSAVNPTAEQLEKLIHELSPEGEPGIRKYFHEPPQESWNPKTGQYSLNIRWTYELDK